MVSFLLDGRRIVLFLPPHVRAGVVSPGGKHPQILPLTVEGSVPLHF